MSESGFQEAIDKMAELIYEKTKKFHPDPVLSYRNELDKHGRPVDAKFIEGVWVLKLEDGYVARWSWMHQGLNTITKDFTWEEIIDDTNKKAEKFFEEEKQTLLEGAFLDRAIGIKYEEDREREGEK